MVRLSFALSALAAVGLWACAPAAIMPQPDDGRALFVENCAACHGETAIGDGPLARAMAKPPANLTLISVRNGDQFPRAKVLSIIDGYTHTDLNGPNMPEFGALLEGDLIPFDTGDGRPTPTPRKLVALVEYLESIQASR